MWRRAREHGRAGDAAWRHPLRAQPDQLTRRSCRAWMRHHRAAAAPAAGADRITRNGDKPVSLPPEPAEGGGGGEPQVAADRGAAIAADHTAVCNVAAARATLNRPGLSGGGPGGRVRAPGLCWGAVNVRMVVCAIQAAALACRPTLAAAGPRTGARTAALIAANPSVQAPSHEGQSAPIWAGVGAEGRPGTRRSGAGAAGRERANAYGRTAAFQARPRTSL